MPLKNEEARREYNRNYQKKNKERILEKRKIWVEENKVKMQDYHKEYHKKWYQENKEERSKQIKEYGKNHPEDNVKRVQKYTRKNKEKVYKYGRIYNKTIAGAYRSYRSSATKKDIVFKLEIEDFAKIVIKPCQYCGDSENKRGIDRIDNEKGYTKDNSAPCCKICNFMKRTMTVKEFLNHVNKIYSHNEKSI